MSKAKSIKDAIELLKLYRNSAQKVADKQLDLLSKIINRASEIHSTPEDNRTSEDQEFLNFYYYLSDEISSSVEAADDYNKSIKSYVNGLKTLNTIASLQDESN
ncbi:hypothetical protein [Citrobacter freundii]|uniref:hypothetical protein n=1 Tax=Citrobacter freundii TaxID=546 RepID=UPI0018C4F279|nr:hypothetical protein [Citrobacter freundii]